MVLEIALGVAFMAIANKLAEKALIDPALEKGLEPFKSWLTRGYDKAKAEQELREKIDAALGEMRNKTPDIYERLKISGWVSGQSPATYELMAAAAVEMVQTDPEIIPESLLKELFLRDADRELLARFLAHLRKQLAVEGQFSALILYCDDLFQNGQLTGLTQKVDTLLKDSQKVTHMVEQLSVHFGLTADDQQALDAYLALCRSRWSSLALPLVRKNVGRLSPEIKRIFVPLQVRDEREEEKIRKESEKRKVRNRLDDPGEEIARSLDFCWAFAKYPKFVLVGMPGCGKTTLLRRTALAFAENRASEDLGWSGEQKIPVFIRLRNFSIYLAENRARFSEPGCGAILAYLEQNLRNDEKLLIPDDFFEKRLKSGDCVVLLDGLDEVLENRVDVAQFVNAFIKKYGGCGNRIGLSSRPKGYEGDVRSQFSEADLPLLEVLPLQPEGINDLIRKVLPLVEANLAVQQTDYQRLSRCIRERKSLNDIAGIPLFCSALVQVYKYHGADLPQRRVDVLAEISDLLLGFWYSQASEISKPEEISKMDGTDTHYDETEDSIEAKGNRLAHLAYWMQADLGVAEIEIEDAVEILVEYLSKQEGAPREKALPWAKNFLRSTHLHSGLFVESNPGVYSFLHKNFMEYFAATSLLSDEEDPIAVILSHIDDAWWEEVLLLAATHPKASNKFRGNLLPALLKDAERYVYSSEAWKRRLWLVGRMADDMTSRLPAIPKRQVVDALYRAVVDPALKPLVRAELADLLDCFWTPEDLYRFITVSQKDGQPFLIGRYPVTNIQYERFLCTENFDERGKEYWCHIPNYSVPDANKEVRLIGECGEEGWDWLNKGFKNKSFIVVDGILFPRYWRNAQFGQGRRHAPVVGVSWWEANAYCRWLWANWEKLPEGQQGLPKPNEFRLPTETEWVSAAGGEKGGRHPWGILYPGDDITRYANTVESQIKRTTPVWMYPQGESELYEIMDLSGNVREWLANYFDNNRDNFTLVGGSWFNNRDFAQVENRCEDHPDYWVNYIGFRVAGVFSPPR